MPRYVANVEFFSTGSDIDIVKLDLKREVAKFFRYGGVEVNSIVKTSITHEQAIDQIKKLMDEPGTYGNVSSDDIQRILDKVV